MISYATACGLFEVQFKKHRLCLASYVDTPSLANAPLRPLVLSAGWLSLPSIFINSATLPASQQIIGR